MQQRSKAKRAKSWKEGGKDRARKGSFRPLPADKGSTKRELDLELLADQAWARKKARIEEPNLENLADVAWSRKEIKTLSQNLESAEDDREAAEIEEEIRVHEAKIASLMPNDEQRDEPPSTACGSRDVPCNDYEEVVVEEEPVVGQPEVSEDDDETWGKWKPSQCLVDLGFSK